MKRFAGAVFLLFTLQLTAGISQQQSDKAATGNFTGKITDETGKPVIGIPVQALQYGIDPAGERVLLQFRAVVSNDRGEYRLFALAPGRYYIGIGGSAPVPSIGRDLRRQFLPRSSRYHSGSYS